MNKSFDDYEVFKHILDYVEPLKGSGKKLVIMEHPLLLKSELKNFNSEIRIEELALKMDTDTTDEDMLDYVKEEYLSMTDSKLKMQDKYYFIEENQIRLKAVTLDIDHPEFEERLSGEYAQCRRLDLANIYLSTNGFKERRLKKCIKNIQGILFDYDYKDTLTPEKNIYNRKFSDMEKFKKYILDYLPHLPLKPYHVLDSGHGIQFVYFFKNVPDEYLTDLELYKKIEKTIKYSIDEQLKLRHDIKADLLTQIFRVPGTNNAKDLENIVSTHLIEMSKQIYEWDEIYNAFEVQKYLELDIVQKNKIQDKEHKQKYKEQKSKIQSTSIKKALSVKEKTSVRIVEKEHLPKIIRPDYDVRIYVSPAMRRYLFIRLNQLEKLAKIRDYDMEGEIRYNFMCIYFNTLYAVCDFETACTISLDMAEKVGYNKAKLITNIINVVPPCYSNGTQSHMKYRTDTIYDLLDINSAEKISIDKGERKKAEKEELKEIVRLYLETDMSQEEIGKQFGYSKSCISKKLKKLNVTKDTKFEDVIFEGHGKYENGNYSKNKINNNIEKYNSSRFQNLIYEEIS